MKNAIILCSGGLDSVVSAYFVREKYAKLKFLFFDYGQRAVMEEEYCSKKIAEKLGASFIKVELPWLGKISTAMLNKEGEFKETTEKDLEDGREEILNWWVPCRNSVFLINALAFAESEYLSKKKRYDVIIGLKNEGSVHMKDTTEKFVKKMNELSEEATHHGGYKIIAPLIKKDKTEVVKIGVELGVPSELTYSCYVGNGFRDGKVVHCGKCLNCMLRKKGFYWSGVNDPSVYL